VVRLSLEDLYKEVILDHYRNPRNKREMPDAPLSCSKNNPLCGDEITVHARLEDGRVVEVAFEGQGCSISQASASMLTEATAGKTVDEADALAREFRGMMEGTVDPDEDAPGANGRSRLF
jgi:nitrogen fixation protein NifU and related proteins